MNNYEGMFIFPESVKEEALEEHLGHVRQEIERLGGQIESVTRLGKRAFARTLGRRHKAGHYAVINFRLDGSQVRALHERLKLGGEVFRAQIIRRDPASAAAATVAAAPSAAAAEETGDGVVQ